MNERGENLVKRVLTILVIILLSFLIVNFAGKGWIYGADVQFNSFTNDTPVDADEFIFWQTGSSSVKNSTGTAMKSWLGGTYFDTLSDFTGTLTDGLLCRYDLANTEIDCDYTDQDSQLTQEQVEDFCGGLVDAVTGTHTRITITYQDATGDIDFIVDDMNDDSPDDDSEVPDAITVTPVNATTETAIEAVVDHDELQGVTANEHIDHSGVTLTAGAGLSGGGDITESRSFSTASQESGFVADGGAVSLTCGAANQGRVQVMDDGSLEYCDGATTSVLQSGFLDSDGIDDDVPDAGDFGNATDLDTNGALNTDSVADNEIDYTAVTLADLTDDVGYEEETHVTEHQENGADELLGENLGTACTDGQILKANATGGLDCGTDVSGGGGTPNILDLGDDASNESTDLVEIATSGDTNSVFTEPTADKLLINLANDWPKADTADDLTCTDCIGDTEISTHSGTSLAADLEEEVTEGSLADDVIVEADLKVVDTPSDEECLTYEATGGDFEWQSCGGGGETNTASSQGSGSSIFYQKSGVDLQFNAVKSESDDISVAVDGVSHDVEFTFNPGNVGLNEFASGIPDLAANSVDAITEIASGLKSGLDTTLMTGTAGTNGNLAKFDGNGDIIDSDVQESQVAELDTAETIVADWVNTANPWADNEVADDITLTDITQITNRSHTSLTDIGTNTHAQIDTHISDTTDAHSVSSDTLTLTNKTIDANGTGNSLTNIDEDNMLDGSDAVRSGIEVIIDGGGSAITTGIKGDIEIPFNATVQRGTVLCDQTGSIIIDLWVDTYANYPPTDADSITASAPLTVTSAVKSQDTSLTGWTTALIAGSTIRYNVDSVSTVTRCTVSLVVEK